MSAPYHQAFGLSCPAGGKFYVCETDTEFIGCCTSNPCNHRGCPSSDLRTSSFSMDNYEDLPRQGCQSSDSLWYTCAMNDIPFMGCCKINPCTDPKVSCPPSSLSPAKLNNEEPFRQKFLHPDSQSSSTTKPSSTKAPTATATPGTGTVSNTQGTASSVPAVSKDTSSGLSTVTIAGIAIGVSILVLVVIALIIWRCGWTAGKQRAQRAQMEAADVASKSPNVASPMMQSNPAYQGSRLQNGAFQDQANNHFRDSYAPSAMTAIASPHKTVYSKPDFDSATLSIYGPAYSAAPTPPAQDQRYSTFSQHSYNSTGSQSNNGYTSGSYSNAPSPSMPVVFEMDSTEARSELSSGTDLEGMRAVTPVPIPVQPPQIRVSSPPISPCLSSQLSKSNGPPTLAKDNFPQPGQIIPSPLGPWPSR